MSNVPGACCDISTFKRPNHQPCSSNSGMGETDDSEKNDAAAKVEKDKHEKKEKHADEDGKGEKGEEKAKDKKKDKSGKEGKEDVGKEKKKKNHEDKKDPAQLKLKLEKLDTKMQALAAKREEILKLLSEVEANQAGGAVPPAAPN